MHIKEMAIQFITISVKKMYAYNEIFFIFI